MNMSPVFCNDHRDTILKIREIFNDDSITNWEKREKSKNLISNDEKYNEDEKEKFYNHIEQLYGRMIRSGIFSLI